MLEVLVSPAATAFIRFLLRTVRGQAEPGKLIDRFLQALLA